MSKAKGAPKSGGRKAGTPNKLTVEVKAMILGALNEVGGQAYLVAQATANPVAFMTLIGKVLPLQHEGPDGGPVQHRIVWGDAQSAPPKT